MFSKDSQGTQEREFASRRFRSALLTRRMQESGWDDPDEVALVDVGEIRRANLRALLDVNGETQADCARRMDTAPAYISQILNQHGGRQMGRDFARRLERIYMLEHGWMDHDHSKSPYEEDRTTSAAAQAMQKRFEAMPEPMKTHIRGLMDQILRNKSPPKARKKK